MSLITFLFGKPALDLRPADPVRQAAECNSLEELKEFLNHRSGYVRESAIGRAVSLRCEGAIPAVMPRLNDHVSQVRNAAQRAVQTLLPFAELSDLLAFLGYTWRLRQFSRWDHGPWIAGTQSALASRLTVSQLREALCSDSLFAIRGGFFLLLERELISRPELLALTIESKSDILMARQAAGLAMSLPPEERIAILDKGLLSHFGAVRTLALRGLLECAPHADEIARNALLDTQASVRSTAQYYLQQTGFDLAAYYREVLLNPIAKTYVYYIAISALGSIGASEDIARVRERTSSPYPSVRGAAFLAWLKLVPADKDAIAAAALADESRSVRKLAAGLAARQGAFIPFERVKELLSGKRDLAILFAFARQRKWDWIGTIAQETAHIERDSPEWDVLKVEMERWLRHAGHSYERPTAAQRDHLLAPEVLRKLKDLCHRMSEDLLYELGLNTKKC